MNISFIQAIDRSKSNPFKGCATISWFILAKILCDRNNFDIDYVGLGLLGLLEKINHFFRIERPNIGSDRFLRSGRYRPKISLSM
ncbi:MAG: hypothetical protein WBA93_37155 [Microcoleaceae cyanobacterium]